MAILALGSFCLPSAAARAEEPASAASSSSSSGSVLKQYLEPKSDSLADLFAPAGSAADASQAGKSNPFEKLIQEYARRRYVRQNPWMRELFPPKSALWDDEFTLKMCKAKDPVGKYAAKLVSKGYYEKSDRPLPIAAAILGDPALTPKNADCTGPLAQAYRHGLADGLGGERSLIQFPISQPMDPKLRARLEDAESQACASYAADQDKSQEHSNQYACCRIGFEAGNKEFETYADLLTDDGQLLGGKLYKKSEDCTDEDTQCIHSYRLGEELALQVCDYKEKNPNACGRPPSGALDESAEIHYPGCFRRGYNLAYKNCSRNLFVESATAQINERMERFSTSFTDGNKKDGKSQGTAGRGD